MTNKIIGLITVILLSIIGMTTVCVASQDEIMETCTFPVRTSENKYAQDLIEPDACVQKKILKLIYEHAPSQYHKEDVHFAFYRSMRTGFVIYVAHQPIPPQPIMKPPLRLFGNWTDGALYYIAIDNGGNVKQKSYLR